MSETVRTSELDKIFTEVVEEYDQLRDVQIEEVHESKTTQQKFSVHALGDILPKISAEASLVRRVSQTDYYFLPENTHPSYVTECICLREEKDLDEADSPIKTTLIFKSNPHSVQGASARTVKSVQVPEDLSGAYTMLGILENTFGEPYASIYKERRIYVGSDANIYLDSNVIATDSHKNQHYLGNYVEITSSQNENFGIKFAQSLGIETSPVQIPYLDYNKLERYQPSEDTLTQPKAPSEQYQNIHYDDMTGVFVLGLDTTKLTDLTESEVQKITKKLDHIEELLSQGITTDANLVLRSDYKPFKYFRSPLQQIANSMVFRYNLNDGDTRIVVSAVTLRDGTKGIILHFIGTHAQYDRWVDRHK